MGSCKDANLENANITQWQAIKIHVWVQSKVVSIHVASEKIYIAFSCSILVDFQNIHYSFITTRLSSTLNIRWAMMGEKYQFSPTSEQFEYVKVFIFLREWCQLDRLGTLLKFFSNLFIFHLGIPRYYISTFVIYSSQGMTITLETEDKVKRKSDSF